MGKVIQEITNIRWKFYNLSANAKRILWFYSFLGKSPIVVIRVPDRQKEERYADLTAAVRGLADDFGLRVIVDGSENSIPPELMDTKRQLNIHVMPMERDQISNIPEFSKLIEFLRKYSLDDGVWDVLGGCPQDYRMLARKVSMSTVDDASDPDKIISEVKDHVRSLLLRALNGNILDSSPNTKSIVKFFRKENSSRIPIMELKDQGYLLDFPNKVFREVERNKGYFVEPASSAVGLIIRENILSGGDVAKLVEKLFSCRNKSV